MIATITRPQSWADGCDHGFIQAMKCLRSSTLGRDIVLQKPLGRHQRAAFPSPTWFLHKAARYQFHRLPLVKTRGKIIFKGRLSFWQGSRKKKSLFTSWKNVNELRWVLLSSVFRGLSVHHQHQHSDVNAKDEKDMQVTSWVWSCFPLEILTQLWEHQFQQIKVLEMINTTSEMSLVFTLKKTLTSSGNN